MSFRRCGYPRLDVIPNPPWASRAPDARLSCLARRLSSCCGMPPCATAPLAWDDAVTQLFLRSGELRCAGSAARWPAGVQCPGERERESGRRHSHQRDAVTRAVVTTGGAQSKLRISFADVSAQMGACVIVLCFGPRLVRFGTRAAWQRTLSTAGGSDGCPGELRSGTRAQRIPQKEAHRSLLWTAARRPRRQPVVGSQ